MNVTVIVSSITALAAVLSPLITSHLNNKHQLKMRKLELYEAKRIKTINEFVSGVSKYLYSPYAESELQMGEVISSVFLYAPESTWSKITELINAVNSDQDKKAKVLLAEIAKELSPSTSVSESYRK